ncbi:hypothetical protein BaRGS_00016527 [Batillaria attramentaria]|uniref:Adenine phosphoribosyltransferase n=1 Tax=Batillaria attramentaria TaxID=370345 RepID=A0ABD0KYK7_9CAEN
MSDRLETVKSLIAAHPDFPKPGILFRDVFPVLRNAKALRMLIDLLCEHIKSTVASADIIVGLESRGFLFGPMVAEQLGIAFVPVRKAGKLPGKTVSVSYTLEYGTDKFEAQEDSVKKGQKVIILDDLLATGGTMKAAIELMEKLGAVVELCLVVIELDDLKGRNKLNRPFYSLIHY